MEREFLNYFYNIRRIVSMIKLTNSKQWKEELVINFKNQLSEASAIEICIQGLNQAISYILQGIEPKTFKELATRAYDVELSIASNGHQSPLVQETRKGRKRKDTHKGGKFPSKLENKQSLIIATAHLKVPVKPKMKKQTPTLTQDKGRRRPML